MTQASQQPQEIRGGPGIFVSRYGKQHVVSARRQRFPFIPAFYPSWNGRAVWIGYGTVNGFEPTINGRPISGGDSPEGPPSVVIEEYDAEGRSWIALRVEVDPKTYKLASADKLTVVNLVSAGERSVGNEGNPLVGFYPIAVASNTGIHQIVHFNLQHAVGIPPFGTDRKPQHFFW